MASTSAGPSKEEVAGLCRVVQLPSISKAQLQTICVVNSLTKTGNKADLQRRIANLIQECEQRRDLQRFSEVKQSIYNNAPIQANAYQPLHQPSNPPSALPSYGNPYNRMGSHGYQMSVSNGQYSSLNQSFEYRKSPFYDIVARIGDVRVCDVMSQHRQTVNSYVRSSDHPILQQVSTDPTLSVMAFCAAANTGVQEITFPYQCELKVNGSDIKANLRGLKNKPGSTRPADLTSYLRLKPSSYNNNVEFTYALTSKKYYFGIYVCRVTPMEELVEKIQKSKRIAKESVIQELSKKASDPDVIATSQNISLKDPLSYMRLRIPCRGLKCTHIQCFDATAYLQLQEQGPQWICPICNNPAPFEHLAVDEYVKDILTNTARFVEQVTIEPNGQWHLTSAAREEKAPEPDASFVDDDDLVIGLASSRQSTTATPNRSVYAFSTPVHGSSREGSSMPPRSATSNKRPAADVIDLTLSDDEEPSRPVKRPNTGNNGFNSWDL